MIDDGRWFMVVHFQYNLGVLISLVRNWSTMAGFFGTILHDYPWFSHLKLRRTAQKLTPRRSSRWLQKVLSQPVRVRGWCGLQEILTFHDFKCNSCAIRIGTLKELKIGLFKEFTKSLQSVSWTCACSHLRPLIVFHWDLDAKHGWMNWRCIIFPAWWPFWIFLASYNPD